MYELLNNRMKVVYFPGLLSLSHQTAELCVYEFYAVWAVEGVCHLKRGLYDDFWRVSDRAIGRTNPNEEGPI